jgi:hypothetical protein
MAATTNGQVSGQGTGSSAADPTYVIFPQAQGIVISKDDDSIETWAAALATRVDEASSTTTYVGKAVPGTAGGDSLWQITRISVSGTVTTIEYADGNDNFDNVWNNRASLSYS